MLNFVLDMNTKYFKNKDFNGGVKELIAKNINSSNKIHTEFNQKLGRYKYKKKNHLKYIVEIIGILKESFNYESKR